MSVTILGLKFTVVPYDINRIKLICDDDFMCTLERATDGSYVIIDVIGRTKGMYDAILNRMMEAKFLALQGTVIHLEKSHRSSIITNGYWGKLPRNGYINAQYRIKYILTKDRKKYMVYGNLVHVDGVRKFVCDYSYPLSEGVSESLVGHIEDPSYFGIV